MTANKEENVFHHDINVGTKEHPLWRHWGYSIALDQFASRPSDACDFCKKGSNERFYKTICHCSLSGGREILKVNLGLNLSLTLENGDIRFYSCEGCTKRLTVAIQQQDKNLDNHLILINAVKAVKEIF